MTTEEEYQQIQHKITGEVGPDGWAIVKILLDADGVLSLEQIEEQLQKDLESKAIRQILYELNDRGWARSRRLRDSETGWITFQWNIFPDKILQS